MNLQGNKAFQKSSVNSADYGVSIQGGGHSANGWCRERIFGDFRVPLYDRELIFSLVKWR